MRGKPNIVQSRIQRTVRRYRGNRNRRPDGIPSRRLFRVNPGEALCRREPYPPIRSLYSFWIWVYILGLSRKTVKRAESLRVEAIGAIAQSPVDFISGDVNDSPD